MKILDLFCGGGGASYGYYLSGILDITGVDIVPQPRYPFKFIQDDFRNIDLSDFDFIHASPPCQRYTRASGRHGVFENHPDLIQECRDLLTDTGIPFVMENVVEAPIRRDLLLCGFMFGLKTIRHRKFELHGFSAKQPEHVPHIGKRGEDYFTVVGHPGGYSNRDNVRIGNSQEWNEAMGIDWLPVRELVQAIPPAYTNYIGTQFLNQYE